MVTPNQGKSTFNEADLPKAALAELRTSSYAELRNVSCTLDNGQCVLTGTVSTFYLKQMAQTILFRHMDATLPFRNRLQVISSEESSPRKEIRRNNTLWSA